MLRTTRILFPSALLSLTLLGLAAIYNGGLVDLRWGPYNRFRVEGVNHHSSESEEAAEPL